MGPSVGGEAWDVGQLQTMSKVCRRPCVCIQVLDSVVLLKVCSELHTDDKLLAVTMSCFAPCFAKGSHSPADTCKEDK